MLRQSFQIWKNGNHRVLRGLSSFSIDQEQVNRFGSTVQSNEYNNCRNLLAAPYLDRKCGQIRCTSSDDSNLLKNDLSKYKDLESKWRADPVITIIDTPQFKSILKKNVLDLVALFQKYNYEIRIAGGAVRDLLMNITPTDIDFATNATPKQMVEMFVTENVRVIKSNGGIFGTITVRINDEENFEVTTLRIGVHTDGKQVDVEFTTDWLLDASRRDLTINSMFLGFDGKVYDYFFGFDDLKNQRIVFVGEPTNRIKADYLRILRYFRFYGRVCENPNNFDAKAIKAIRENIDGLQIISGERIRVELKKILHGNHRIELLIKLIECGASRYMGFPAAVDCDDLLRLKQTLETTFEDVDINWIIILSTLISSKDDAIHLNSRLKFKAGERDLAIFLGENKTATRHIDDILHYQKMCVPQQGHSFKVRKDFVLALLVYNGKRPIYDQLLDWKIPKYPVNRTILEKHGCRGHSAELILERLRLIWADSNFQISENELLQQHLADVKEKVFAELKERKLQKKASRLRENITP
ncbi:CCA tRNA nucleotidyltransferase 1, mitochondrial-like [Contarinia nasturtii]|uniref:CCA tRNA nucleotidyltransferase 1, mitochondrial-like n=1 Tax=Contarinia nasturtii TaxID=265458 RepID=UPI0012D38F35|nr:CCA tRNA nucleotidyltransferase 1, mitochondrial-like [Contarinia nasturtii]